STQASSSLNEMCQYPPHGRATDTSSALILRFSSRQGTRPPQVIHALSPSLRNPELAEQECVIKSRILQPVIPARGPAVPARYQPDLEQQRVVVSLHRPQFGDILCRLPVHHLTVIERSPDEHRRVGLRFDVVVRRPGLHVTVCLLLVRV